MGVAMKKTLILLLASAILLGACLKANAACNWLSNWIGICEGSEILGQKALESVQVLTKQIQDTQDLLNRTVPGLRESTELNDLSSSDPKIRAAAAERYRQLANAADAIGAGGTKLPAYKLAVSFDFDTDTKKHSTLLCRKRKTALKARHGYMLNKALSNCRIKQLRKLSICSR
jgi:hypothetical protein